jgi:hypothetical protein
MDAWADCNLQRSTQHPGVHRVPPKRFVKKRAQARPRHRLTVQERLARDRRQAPIHPLVVIWVTPLWCLQKRSHPLQDFSL